MGLEQISSTLDLLIGYQVDLYVGGEPVKGKLISVVPDHIILENENNNIIYYNIDQIQAISKNTKQFQNEEINVDYLQTQSMVDLLTSLKDSWVTIICLNQQKFNGIISTVDQHFVTLISGEDRIFIKINHISNILRGQVNQSNSSNQENSQDKNLGQADNQGKLEEKQNHYPYEGVIEKEYRTRFISGEMQQIKSPMISGNIGKESRVWSQPIKTSEKQNEPSLQSNNIDMKKPKESTNIKQKAENQKVEKEIRKTKEIKGIKRQESKSKTNLEQVSTKRPSGEKRNPTQPDMDELHQKDPFMNVFRFAGEPVSMQGKEHPSLFAGWTGNSKGQ